MKIQAAFGDVEATDELKEKVIESFGSLKKNLQDFKEDLLVADVRVEKRSRWGYRVSFDMQLPGKHIFAEEKGEDLMKTVRDCRDAARRQVRKHVEKLQDYKKK